MARVVVRSVRCKTIFTKKFDKGKDYIPININNNNEKTKNISYGHC